MITFTINAMASKIDPKSSANANCPLPVSNTIAVVNTRVWPSIFPPTIHTAPTSEMLRPNAVATASRTPARAWASNFHFACHSLAAQCAKLKVKVVRDCCDRGHSDSHDERQVEDHLRRIIARGVYNNPKKPRGPLRESSK